MRFNTAALAAALTGISSALLIAESQGTFMFWSLRIRDANCVRNCYLFFNIMTVLTDAFVL
jgi:hypothetical protein